ncbi:unnamed protein product, partial [Chrysoparadoxa australica]
ISPVQGRGSCAARCQAKPSGKLPDLSQSTFPDIPEDGYDLVVLGSGPGGETAAAHASQLGANVAVVEVKKSFGGPTGLTSKAVREATKQIVKAVDQVGGDRRRQIRRLWEQRFPKLRGEAEVLQLAETRTRLQSNLVDLFIGAAVLVPPSESMSGQLAVRVCRPTGCVELPTQKVCIATGSRPARPEELRPGVKLPFTKKTVVDATEMGQLVGLPNAVAILGGGVISVEYATVLAKLGVGVSLLCKPEQFMPFLPQELRVALKKRMLKDKILFLDADVKRMDVGNDGLVRVQLEDKPKQPKRLRVDLVLYSGGRDANSGSIDCEAVGVGVGKYGRIEVDENYRTANSDIFAIGDVIGGGLASAAQQQARVVTEIMFRDRLEAAAQGMMIANQGSDLDDLPVDDSFDDQVGAHPFPIIAGNCALAASPEDASSIEQEQFAEAPPSGQGVLFGNKKIDAPLTLWTIPEIATVGTSVEQAFKLGQRFITNDGRTGSIVQGYASFKDLARGRLSGDPEGYLKIIARADGPSRHIIIGVHIIGEGANELIQLGSILVHSEATLEQVSNTPFAAVTLSALYQMASDDALCKSPLNAQSRFVFYLTLSHLTLTTCTLLVWQAKQNEVDPGQDQDKGCCVTCGPIWCKFKRPS